MAFLDVLFAAAAVLAPVVAGGALIVLGLLRDRAPWPWLIGLGLALVPAAYMAAVDLCGRLAGTCIEGDELSTSRQAIVSVALFALAAALLPVRRSPARDAAVAALVLAGQAWLLLKLLESHEGPPAILVGALIGLEIGYEVAGRLRRSAAPA